MLQYAGRGGFIRTDDYAERGALVSSTRMLVLFVAGLLLAGLAVQVCLADRGMLPLADVSVFGPGQKAIVAWNGLEEILILSTDVYADAATTVLEVLPLPSEPDVIEKTDLAPFVAINSLMRDHSPLGEFRGGGKQTGVEIVFHDKIGSHDITVIRVDDSRQFEDWANDFLEERGMGKRVSSQKLASLVDSYIRDRFPYFVLDLVELSPEPRSIEPILYKFKSSSLYFPLRISTLASGSTEIAIFAISSGPVYEEEIPPALNLARFAGALGGPVRFKVPKTDLESIHPMISSLFSGDAWLSAIKFSGELKDLDADLSVSQVQTPLADRLISSAVFWLIAGVVAGVLLGLILGHMSLGVLKIGVRRLVAALDLIGCLLLMLLSSVLGYGWAAYFFWVLVALGIASLFLAARTAGRGRLVLFIALPFAALLLVYCLILSGKMEIGAALVVFLGLLFAAALPPRRERRLSEPLRRTSRWFVPSRKRGPI